MAPLLIVDDEFGILETLRDLLEDEGYRTLVATNGRRALEIMANEQPALCIVDFMMPMMNGRELVLAMQKDERLKGIPVVMMSASPREAWADVPTAANLFKPFELQDLLDTVTRLVGAPQK